MNKFRNEIIIDSKFSDLDADLRSEKVTLVGTQDINYSNYMKSLKLIIEKNNDKQVFNINLEGYNFNLVMANLIKEKNENQIIITGQYGGTGGYVTFNILQYKNNKLKLLLNDEMLNNEINCYAKYLDDYKVDIYCDNKNEGYTIDISKKYKGYLDLVYDKNGKVIEGITPTVSDVNTIYPIIPPYKDSYNLQVQKRIVGVSNADLLGAIQIVFELDEKSNINVKEQYFLLIDREDM